MEYSSGNISNNYKIMNVGLLVTEEEKDSLIGVKYDGVQYFNPVQDFYGRWIISIQEMEQCTNPDFQWVKDLELIEWVPPESN